MQTSVGIGVYLCDEVIAILSAFCVYWFLSIEELNLFVQTNPPACVTFNYETTISGRDAE